MRTILITILLSLSLSIVIGQEMTQENQKIVSDFIDCFKNQNKNKLVSKISFPLKRKYPLPDIKNKQEFLIRYSEVFDDSLIKMIVNSKPSKDWSEVGWRGLMLFNGEIWLNYDGSLLGVRESKVELQKREALIKIEKSRLHASIKEFKIPVELLETKNFRIRIDDLGDGNYRFASWPLKRKMSEKPDIILDKGERIPEGSGGDHRYEFKNKDYIYTCSIIFMGEDGSPPALLTIQKDGKEILSQKAKIIRK